jgi:hypothetical protein
MAQAGDSDFLYHYTSCSGLLGILESGELHLSDARFLNDSSEWLHAGHIVATTISSMRESLWPRFEEKHCRRDAFDALLDKMSRHFMSVPVFNPLRGGGHGFPFIFSLSRKRDDLGQWRAYGMGEYCVVFRRQKLDELKGVCLIDVHYHDEKNPDDGIGGIIAEMMARVVGVVEGQIVREDVSDEYAYTLQLMLQDKKNYFIKMKSNYFEEEGEVRLVGQVSPNGKPAIYFKTQGRYAKPYIKVELVPDAIEGVICGPGADKGLSHNMFGMLRAKLGKSWSLEFSGAPFRS